MASTTKPVGARRTTRAGTIAFVLAGTLLTSMAFSGCSASADLDADFISGGPTPTASAPPSASRNGQADAAASSDDYTLTVVNNSSYTLSEETAGDFATIGSATTVSDKLPVGKPAPDWELYGSSPWRNTGWGVEMAVHVPGIGENSVKCPVIGGVQAPIVTAT